MTLTSYSLLSKSTSSMSTKSPLQAKNYTFFLATARAKIKPRIHQSTPFQVNSSILFCEGARTYPPVGRNTTFSLLTPHPKPKIFNPSVYPPSVGHFTPVHFPSWTFPLTQTINLTLTLILTLTIF